MENQNRENRDPNKRQSNNGIEQGKLAMPQRHDEQDRADSIERVSDEQR